MKASHLAIIVVLGTAGATGPAAQTIRIAPPVRPPVSDADVLVLHEYARTTGQLSGTMPARYVTEIRRRLSPLLDIAVIDGGFTSAPLYVTREAAERAVAIGGGRSSLELRGGGATFNALSVLRVRPQLGRDFSAGDVEAGRRLVLLTDATWRQMFGRRGDVVGMSVWSGEKGAQPVAFEVAGVLPPGVMTENPEIDPRIDALVLIQTRFEIPSPDERWWAPIVRLKPGVALETVQTGIDNAVAAARRALDVGTPTDSLGARLDTMRRGPLGR